MIRVTEGDQNKSEERARWSDALAQNETLDQDSALYFHQVLSTPCLDEIIHAQGPWITTASGRKVLDFHGNSVHQIGFGHPAVVRAVHDQMRSLPYCTRRYTNQSAVALAQRLVSHAPGTLRNNARILLTPSGSAAVGIALKIAFACTGRHHTIAFDDSFHGATLDAASLSGQELFRRGMGPMLPGVIHVPTLSNEYAIEEIEAHLDSRQVAALIAEPIRATCVRHIPHELWKRVRDACDRTGTLLIFDEIPTGLGRSGTLWATEHTGVTPDLMVIGKGLGGGIIPQAAVIGRAELNEIGEIPVRNLALGHYTHEKSPVGSAAALSTLETILDENLVSRSRDLGAWWSSELNRSLHNQPGVREVRQIGLMVAIELDSPSHADNAMYKALRKGLSFKVGAETNLVLFPPLNIETDLLNQATEILTSAISLAATNT